jgi:hypothetical protein
MKIVYWICRIVAAVILLQTLYFKFGASEESVYIFETVHMEPWGRIGVGVFELIAAALILINTTAWLGSILALGLMAGAIGMHLTLLGIEVRDDGGLLFLYALIVTACAIFILYYNREKIRELISTFGQK